MTIDVVIIGAGPAGSTVGEIIAKAGFNVSIHDKDCSPGRNKICGGAVAKRHVMDTNLPKHIAEKKIHNLVFHFPNERMSIDNRLGYLIFDRGKLDQFLVQQAIKSGAEVLNSSKVIDVAKKHSDMEILLMELPHRKIRKIKAKLVVFADGANTLANKKFHIGFQNSPNCTALAAAYDLQWEKNPIDSLEFFFSDNVSSTGYGWIFPRKNSINIGLNCLISKIKQNIRQSLDQLLEIKKLNSLKVLKFGGRLVPQSIPEKIHGDSMLVVGDAAGTTEPISGSGIANAIVNGKIAAKIAIEALDSNNLTANYLVRYENDWRKTLNYENSVRYYFLQKIALRAGINPAIYLKEKGFFDNYN